MWIGVVFGEETLYSLTLSAQVSEKGSIQCNISGSVGSLLTNAMGFVHWQMLTAYLQRDDVN